MSKFISTAPAPGAAIRPSDGPKGAEYEAVPGGGRPRDAGSDGGNGGYGGGLLQAEALIDVIEAEYLLADRDYDTNKVLAAARARGMAPVIPPKRSRRSPQEYDEALYQARYFGGELLWEVVGLA